MGPIRRRWRPRSYEKTVHPSDIARFLEVVFAIDFRVDYGKEGFYRGVVRCSSRTCYRAPETQQDSPKPIANQITRAKEIKTKHTWATFVAPRFLARPPRSLGSSELGVMSSMKTKMPLTNKRGDVEVLRQCQYQHYVKPNALTEVQGRQKYHQEPSGVFQLPAQRCPPGVITHANRYTSGNNQDR